MEGLVARQALLDKSETPFGYGSTPSLADICLVPQMANGRRLGCNLSAVPRLEGRRRNPQCTCGLPGCQTGTSIGCRALILR